jgi:hypothetical protein
VPRTSETTTAEPPEQRPAVEPRPATQHEEPVQLIRSGGGCVACPGERGPSGGQLPRFRRPAPSPSDRADAS